MKSWLTTFILAFAILHQAFAIPAGVEPEKIESITKVTYDYSYYEEQAQLWQQRIQENKNDGNAWYNYYQAARYANMFDKTLEKKFDLNTIVGKMPTTIANTFEFNYILFIHENKMEKRFEHLLKAHELAPERIDAYHAMVNYHLTEGNTEQVAFYSTELFKAGEFSPSLLAWNYNVLASVEKNGILLTHGDNDSYPAWVIQTVKNVRKDVKVLNVNLLMYDKYRDRILSELGVSPISSAEHSNYEGMYLDIIQKIGLQSKRPVYVATSVPRHIREQLGDSLYLVGLAFKYSPEPFDNLAFLKNNFEKRFLKDHLHIQLEPDTGSNVIANMNMHYLPALITLRKHYQESGDPTKANEIEPMIRQIANEAGQEKYISQYLGENSNTNQPFLTTISARTLQKNMVAVRNNLYASATEVTQEEYDAFLLDLLKNKEYDLLEKCKSPKTDWRSLLPEKFQHLSDEEVFPNAHPDDPKAPVQNISHEAAIEYCKWITKVYNNSTDKKKEYGEVEFRLPLEEEWEFAAHGNHTAPFPWGGYYFRNTKGCFLFNTNVADEKPCEDCPDKARSIANDGGFFTVFADAYFPNDFGIYNASGNVAEMISVKGIAKGGSWEDHPDESTIGSQKIYSEPSSAIGFRVFMKVK